MNLRKKARAHVAQQNRAENLLSTAGFVLTLLPAIGIAFFVALKTFWFCPQGGCSLESANAKLGLLLNGVGVISLIIVFSLLLQFPFLLLVRPLYSRKTVENVYLSFSLPALRWYDFLISKWIALLWYGR